MDRETIRAALVHTSTVAMESEGFPRTLTVQNLGRSGAVMAASDTDGTWAIAIATTDSGPPLPPLKLEVLSAEYGSKYTLTEGAHARALQVCVIRCRTSDPAVQELFVAFAALLIETLPEVATPADVASEVDRWVSLFWRLTTPARTDVVGLVGELVLLDAASDVALWVRAWHSEPTSTIDFVFGESGTEIEVKATQGASRIHIITIQQAVPSKMAERYFASVQVDLRETGVPIGDVVRGIADRIDDQDVLQRFWRILTETCGSSMSEFFEERFVVGYSRDSLSYWRAAEIPRPNIELPLPPGVSDLSFRSDFSACAPCRTLQI